MNEVKDEWWQVTTGSVRPAELTTSEGSARPEPGQALALEDPEVSKAPEGVTEEKKGKPDRRKGVLMGAAGAALAGVVLFAAMPDDIPAAPSDATATALAPSSTFLPPAGGAPQEEVESGTTVPPEPAQGASEQTLPMEPVSLDMKPAGQGKTGAIVKVTISNYTDSGITVMSSMMQGDNRAAMVGEGTLAPGARRVEPGETIEGTVEFATRKPPSQIVLLDLSGEVVAAT